MLRPPQGIKNPGSGDRERHLASLGVRAVAVVPPAALVRLGGLAAYPGASPPGERWEWLELVVLRGGARQSFDIAVIEQSHDFERLFDLVDLEKGLVPRLGIVSLDIDDRIAKMLPELRVASGVIVVAKAAAPNVDTPLIPGDVIHSINGVSISTVSTLRAALDQLKPDSAAVLQIERERKLMFVSLQLE